MNIYTQLISNYYFKYGIINARWQYGRYASVEEMEEHVNLLETAKQIKEALQILVDAKVDSGATAQELEEWFKSLQ